MINQEQLKNSADQTLSILKNANNNLVDANNYIDVLDLLLLKTHILMLSHPLVSKIVKENRIINVKSSGYNGYEEAVAEYAKTLNTDVVFNNTKIIINRIKAFQNLIKTNNEKFAQNNLDGLINSVFTEKYLTESLGKFILFIEDIDNIQDNIKKQYALVYKYTYSVTKFESANSIDTFLETLKKLNKKMAVSFEKCKKFISLGYDVTLYKEAALDAFVDAAETYNNGSEKIINNFEKGNKNIQGSKPKTAKCNYVKTLSSKDAENIEFINMVNDLYNEFANGTYIDLTRGYSQSSMDLYKILENKFTKFCKNFKMPLDNNVSMAHAKSAYNQLVEMIEKVYEISEQDYIINDPTKNIEMGEN